MSISSSEDLLARLMAKQVLQCYARAMREIDIHCEAYGREWLYDWVSLSAPGSYNRSRLALPAWHLPEREAGSGWRF